MGGGENGGGDSGCGSDQCDCQVFHHDGEEDPFFGQAEAFDEGVDVEVFPVHEKGDGSKDECQSTTGEASKEESPVFAVIFQFLEEL